MGVTKYILKHPVTTVMALLCLVVFGISSVFSAKLEQMPDMETPMLIIMANYSGAGPEDISALVTEPIEEAIGTMEGVDTISSTSSDGRSMIMLQYDYGTDMDEAYDNLKQKLDNIQRTLPYLCCPAASESKRRSSPDRCNGKCRPGLSLPHTHLPHPTEK